MMYDGEGSRKSSLSLCSICVWAMSRKGGYKAGCPDDGYEEPRTIHLWLSRAKRMSLLRKVEENAKAELVLDRPQNCQFFVFVC